MTNPELDLKISEIKIYLETKVPHLATKEDVLSAVSSALEKHVKEVHSRGSLSNKQVGLLVSAGVALAGALTAVLTGLVG
jgi:hypothetical protein